MQNRIKKVRMRAGLSCAALARELGYRPDTLGRIERGERGLRTELAIKIAEVCNCSVDELIGADLTSAAMPVLPDDPTDPLPIVGKQVLGVGVVMTSTGATIPRPAIMAGISDAYGFDVPNDLMAPRYFAGEVLLVDPTRAAKPGDFVIVGRQIDGQELGTVHRLTDLDDSTATLVTISAPGHAVDMPTDTLARLDVVVGSLIGR